VDTGLPGGILSNQKSQFGFILEAFGMEDVGIVYSHQEYLTANWYILRPFGTFCDHLVYFSLFGMLHQNKSGNPGVGLLSGSKFHLTCLFMFSYT
jgi:hypothetical protein